MVKHILEKHTNPAPAVKCDQCEHTAADIGALNVHKVTMHGQHEELESKELVKMFFHLIHDALVATNETLEKISSDTEDKFNKIVEAQDNLKLNMMLMKNEVTTIKDEAKEVKNLLIILKYQYLAWSIIGLGYYGELSVSRKRLGFLSLIWGQSLHAFLSPLFSA